jgi:hypothetical protein
MTPLWFWYEDLGPWTTPKTWKLILADCNPEDLRGLPFPAPGQILFLDELEPFTGK